MSEVLATAEFSSVIHNNEVCEEIVKWGNKNGYPLTKAKLYNSLGGAYVGFAPGYLIKATRRPPVPGGWDVTVEPMMPKHASFRLTLTKKPAKLTALF